MKYPHPMRCALCRYAVRKPAQNGTIIICGCNADDELDTSIEIRGWIATFGCCTMRPFLKRGEEE